MHSSPDFKSRPLNHASSCGLNMENSLRTKPISGNCPGCSRPILAAALCRALPGRRVSDPNINLGFKSFLDPLWCRTVQMSLVFRLDLTSRPIPSPDALVFQCDLQSQSEGPSISPPTGTSWSSSADADPTQQADFLSIPLHPSQTAPTTSPKMISFCQMQKLICIFEKKHIWEGFLNTKYYFSSLWCCCMWLNHIYAVPCWPLSKM